MCVFVFWAAAAAASMYFRFVVKRALRVATCVCVSSECDSVCVCVCGNVCASLREYVCVCDSPVCLLLRELMAKGCV